MDLCLLCLEIRSSPDEGIQVDSSQWKDENVAELIEKYFWTMTMKTMANTTWLCMPCWQTIIDFHNFYIRIENAHVHFALALKTETQDNYEIESFSPENEQTTETTNDAQLELEQPITMERSIEQSLEQFPEEEKDLSLNEESETELKVGKICDIKPSAKRKRLGYKDPLKKNAKATKCKTLASEKILETTNNTKISHKDNAKGNKANGFISDDELDTDEKCNTDSDNTIDSDCDEKSPAHPYYKQSAKHKAQDEFVANNFKLNCGICQSRFNTFCDVCKHSAVEHNQRGFVSCCNKKFFRRSVLVDHINWHLDPEYFKCKDCGKIMADRRCLNIHFRVHEKKDRTHICDECGKGFPRALALRRHKLIHLPDEQKKYSCNQCGKNFADNNLLSNHERSVHLNKYALVCDICGRSMRSKDVFERHMLKHEGRPIPTISCDVCGLKMINPRGLKRHKEIQHPEGGRVEYKCHICSKVSPSIKAHKKHVHYQHELGYDFKCAVCEKAFKRAIALTEHMAAHTGTKLYTCPYCPKKFSSNANMHSHRKKGHPKEWEEACRAKYSGNLPPNYKPTNTLSV